MPRTRSVLVRPFDPGNFRFLVSIVAVAEMGARDSGGGYERASPTTHAQVYAIIEAVAGDRLAQAGKDEDQVTHRVTCREWIDGVTTEMEVQDGTRRLRIVSPPLDRWGNRTEMELLTREIPQITGVDS